MKKLIPLLLLVFLLPGCGAAPQETKVPAPATEPAATVSTLPEGFYEAGSPLEVQTQNAVRVYPLTGLTCDSAAVMGKNLLLFAPAETGTTLTVLTGETLSPAASVQLDTVLHAREKSVLVNRDGVSYYDPQSREVVVLDENLREITAIDLPDTLLGTPLMSADRATLYYATADSICALDLETRIPRVLRQLTAAEITVEDLLLDGSLLQCSIRDEKGAWTTQFLSTQTGQLMEETEGFAELETSGDRYIATLTREDMPVLVFGTGDTAPQTLYTGARAEYYLLPESYAALQITLGDSVTLDYFDLTTGLRSSTLTLEAESCPSIADGGDGILWLLSRDAGQEYPVLYRWDTNALPSGDGTNYTGTYYTRSSPDLAGIAQCQDLARQISERHGVEVLVWEDAIAVQPWDYRMTEEYLVPILTEQLTLLDQRLGNFPEGFLAKLGENCSGLTICLVRQLKGSAGYDSLEAAAGIQFWEGDHAYIALSTVSSTEGSLYHELCHVIDTRVFSESNAYDQWETLNPNGFEYDYDYAANAQRNAGEYLRDAERCFIDTYSMSFPKEDRARILEYAMTAGNESYFQSKTMQNKLRQICIGIREAFGLKKSEETFLWEQYLQESLAYQK